MRKNVNERLKVEKGLENYDEWKTLSGSDEEIRDDELRAIHERKLRMAEDRADSERDER